MLYPFKFEPILKPVLWGGDAIGPFKGIAAGDTIGESWELSGVAGHLSTVSNGAWKGKNLAELIADAGADLLGQAVVERFGTTFPLLIKLIDARQALSIQVHPNDELAQQRHHSPGKTEMWYIVKAAPGASLYSGFKATLDAAAYEQSLQDDTFIQSLQKYDVRAGDVFFLPAGCVHAIGAGCFIAEIQQTSDITYRIYDYNRKDANGQPRQLHTEWAKAAINYRPHPDSKIDYRPGAKQRQSLVRCPYFTTNVIEGRAGDALSIRHTQDSFVILLCLQGLVTIRDSRSNAISLKQGETVLVPATHLRPLRIEFSADSRLLETYIE
jgi:mannose-6-phosphate isomerase